MSDVNPNVSVGEESSIEAGFGEDGLTSFDDMEAVTSTEDEELEETPETVEAAETEEVEAEVELEEEIKLIKAMRGENEHDVPEDAVFVQKVNGVDTEVSLRELLNDYSGKTDYNKKYNEFGQEKQALKKDRFEFENRIGTFVKKAGENKIDALAYLAETAGADPVAFIKEFKEGLIPDLETYMNMSPAERDAYDSKQELDILRKSNETRDSHAEQLKAHEELEAQVNQQIESLGIKQDEYVAAYDRLVESGTIPADQVGPESIAQWIELENRVSLVDNVLMDIDSDLAEDVALIEDLVKTSLKGGLDEQATREVINEIYGQPSKEAKSASKKVAQSRTNLKSVANKIVENDSGSDQYGADAGPISFDDV